MARKPLTLFRSGILFGSGDPLLDRKMNRLFDDVLEGHALSQKTAGWHGQLPQGHDLIRQRIGGVP